MEVVACVRFARKDTFKLGHVDTDIIIRIERMTSLGRHELGPIAMEALRYRANGSEDPDSVLNQPSSAMPRSFSPERTSAAARPRSGRVGADGAWHPLCHRT